MTYALYAASWLLHMYSTCLYFPTCRTVWEGSLEPAAAQLRTCTCKNLAEQGCTLYVHAYIEPSFLWSMSASIQTRLQVHCVHINICMSIHVHVQRDLFGSVGSFQYLYLALTANISASLWHTLHNRMYMYTSCKYMYLIIGLWWCLQKADIHKAVWSIDLHVHVCNALFV